MVRAGAKFSFSSFGRHLLRFLSALSRLSTSIIRVRLCGSLSDLLIASNSLLSGLALSFSCLLCPLSDTRWASDDINMLLTSCMVSIYFTVKSPRLVVPKQHAIALMSAIFSNVSHAISSSLACGTGCTAYEYMLSMFHIDSTFAASSVPQCTPFLINTFYALDAFYIRFRLDLIAVPFVLAVIPGIIRLIRV